MIFKEKIFTGKNGTHYTLRSPQPEDAEQMIDYLKRTAMETEYGISYPEEMDFSIQEEMDFITKYAEDPGSLIISVFEGETLVGSASLTCVLDKQKTRHRASFGVALLKSVWGQGLGYEIVSGLTAFSREAGYEQIELEVVSSNTTAINLYKKLGFSVYGERPRSFRLKDGSYSDELLMVLALK